MSKYKETDKDGISLKCPWPECKDLVFKTLELKAKHIALAHLKKK